jgi:hypothetical protein
VFLSLTTAFEIEQIIQLIALCLLSVGLFSYSKIIKKNMPGQNIIPEELPTQKNKNSPYSPLTTSIYQGKDVSNDFQKTASSECNHEVGYLATFPSNASLPEECMNCKKLIECKQS